MTIKAETELIKYNLGHCQKAHMITRDLQKSSLDICLVSLEDTSNRSRIRMKTTHAPFRKWRSTLEAGSILRLADNSLHKVNEIEILWRGKQGKQGDGAYLYCSPIDRDDLEELHKKALFALELDYDYLPAL